MADAVHWLDETEQDAWRALIGTTTVLFARLDRDLEQAEGLSHGDYGILANLSEAPGQRLRMTELADRVLESKSRLSHHISRLEVAGLVSRERCETDRRGAFAVLTPAGRERVERAAPGHVASVRAHFFDHLSRRQVEMLAGTLGRVYAALRRPPARAGDVTGWEVHRGGTADQ